MWFYFGSKIFHNHENRRKVEKYDEKYVEKSTKNIRISFLKVREGGHMVGSGRVVSIIE